MALPKKSAYAHLYLGDPAEDPAPVFRDLSPDGVRLPDGTLVPWTEEAVFAVVLYTLSPDPTPVERLEFYGSDGWPLGFPSAFRDLPDDTKRDLQTCFCGWRGWAHRLDGLRRDPLRLSRIRIEAALICGIYPALPEPIVRT